MKIIVKSKNETSHIHPYAKGKYGDSLEVADLFAVQRKYCGEIKVREWHKRECNGKTAAFETVAKQSDEEVVLLLRKEIEKRVLAGEAVKISIVRTNAEGNAMRPMILADVAQGNVERLAELYNLRAAGKEYDESEMEALGLNPMSVQALIA